MGVTLSATAVATGARRSRELPALLHPLVQIRFHLNPPLPLHHTKGQPCQRQESERQKMREDVTGERTLLM